MDPPKADFEVKMAYLPTAMRSHFERLETGLPLFTY